MDTQNESMKKSHRVPLPAYFFETGKSEDFRSSRTG